MEWLDGDTAALMGMAGSMADGSWWTPYKERIMSESDNGKVYGLWAEVRKEVGVLKAKTKAGVKFKVRSNDELVDRLRPVCDKLGVLVYPTGVEAKGHVVESGTLAEATVTLRVRCIEDGSFFDIVGFGLGADNQDKAGGKAGTYAFKSAVVQALLAGGEKDTDDTDTPIVGGVRPPQRKGPVPGAPVLTLAEVQSRVAEALAARSGDALRAAIDSARGLSEADQNVVSADIKAAAAYIRSQA